MTRVLKAALALCLTLPVSAVAQSVEYAASVSLLPGLRSVYTNCYSIDARKGWQRVPKPPQADAQFGVLTPLNVPVERLERHGVPYLWSVDDARFARVDPNGHVGADAAALQPFDGFKFDQRFPFAALLARGEDVPVQRVMGMQKAVAIPAGTDWLDFRINDTGLADNGGGIFLCTGSPQ